MTQMAVYGRCDQQVLLGVGQMEFSESRVLTTLECVELEMKLNRKPGQPESFQMRCRKERRKSNRRLLGRIGRYGLRRLVLEEAGRERCKTGATYHNPHTTCKS